MYLIIDSVTYNIPMKSIRRKADPLYRYAERTQDGVLHSELIGIYFNYSLEMASSTVNAADYIALWQKITEPVESHSITVPDEDGTFTFDCYFANMNDDEVKARDDGTRVFRNLTFDVIGISPARTPA